MKLGEEDKFHKKFAKIIRQYEQHNALKCLWWSYDASGERRVGSTGSLLKAKGLNSGHADYTFYFKRSDICYTIFLEFKCDKNKQQPNQKAFQNCFNGCENVLYQVVYGSENDLREPIAILQKFSIIPK